MGYLVACVFGAWCLRMHWEVIGLRQQLREQGLRLDAHRKALQLDAYHAQYRSAQQWRAIGALQAHMGCEDEACPMDDFVSFEEWLQQGGGDGL